MELCSIASGSSGNCIFTGSGECGLLIDAGISGKKIEAGLNSIGRKAEEMDGILVTHEHSDHIKSLGVMARRFGLPIYATAGTIDYMIRHQAIGKVDESLFHTVEAGKSFIIKDMEITPIATSHDAADPVAYTMKSGDKRMAVITDLGKYDDHIVEALQGLDVLLLEANHDVKMLQAGPYPYYLQQRILGDRGHLSNELSGQLLGKVLHDHFHKVILGHLSKENNYPSLAHEAVKMEVTMGDNPYHGNDFPILVAKRDEVSELIEI